MRYFTLENSNLKELDITTQEIFFHDIGGLGFSEDADFRRIGDVWWLDSVAYDQGEITGKVIFTEYGDTTPYQKYSMFKDFIEKAPLILNYSPHGFGTIIYKRRVRVTELEKTEYTEYGVLDCSITFTAYTPWYQTYALDNYASLPSDDDEDDTGWIWGDYVNGAYVVPPLVFEPLKDSEGYYIEDENQNRIPATRARFGAVPLRRLEFPEVITSNKNPIKLTIYGPAINPTWELQNNGVTVMSGGFDGNFTIASNQYLVVDNTTGQYTMELYTIGSDLVVNVYQLRDFDKTCFLTLKEGHNAVAVRDEGDEVVRFSVEGQVYYATV